MEKFRDRDTGEIKSRAQVASGFNGVLPKIWKTATFDALNVDPVLPSPRPAPSSVDKRIIANGVVQDGNGNWVESWLEVGRFQDQAERDSFAASRLAERIAAVRHKAAGLRDGGVVIDGLSISTSASARTLLTGAAENPVPSRKIVTSGGRAEVSDTAFAAIYAAVVGYIQAVTDREFDLIEELETAAAVDLINLEAVDIEVSWPSNSISTA